MLMVSLMSPTYVGSIYTAKKSRFTRTNRVNLILPETALLIPGEDNKEIHLLPAISAKALSIHPTWSFLYRSDPGRYMQCPKWDRNLWAVDCTLMS